MYHCYENAKARKERETANKKQKALLVIPGATGGSEGGHIQIVTKAAYDSGFHVMVMNPIAPSNTAHRTDLELIDFSREWPVAEAVKMLRE